MIHVRNIQFHPNSKEELLPDFENGFPYISSVADISHYPDAFVPWHWHKAAELFIVNSGTVTYFIPGKQIQFHEGEAGFLNSDILHMTKTKDENTTQMLHLFDPAIIAGSTTSILYQTYVFPVVSNPVFDILQFPKDSKITQMIAQSFTIPENDVFEMCIRNALSEIWLEMTEYAQSSPQTVHIEAKTDTKLKEMIAWIYENYARNISVTDIAQSAFISERECYRIFKDYLHTTPNAFLTNYRLDVAAEMLVETDKTIASIGYETGLGTSSHFIQLFRKAKGCTPAAYRTKRRRV